jgi:membrane-associated protein
VAAHIFELLRRYFDQYGYWTVALALLLENAGVPVPGETVLLLAGFLTYSEHEFRLLYVIVVGIIAATCGDNLGYAIGHYGGRPLLERHRHIFRISPRHIQQAESLFHKHGSLAVFFARFVFGMRVIAGPLAGVLRMPWKRFVLFNFLGAATWVAVIAGLGYIFGRNWEHLLHLVKRADIIIFVFVTALAAWLIWRYRRHASEPERQ